MAKWRIKATILKHWVRLWWRVTIEETLAPITDRSALLSYLIVVALIFYVLPFYGFQQWKGHVVDVWHTIQAFFLAILPFFLLNTFRAIFITRKRVKQLGQWFGNRFVYHSPQCVHTLLVSADDNDKTQIFKVEDAPIGSLVAVLIEIDSVTDHVKAQVVWPRGQNLMDWRGVHKNIKVSLKLPNDSLLALRTYAIPDTSPTVIRVYVPHWDIN